MNTRRNRQRLLDLWPHLKRRLGAILMAFLAIWSIVSFTVKRLSEGADWPYAIGSGFLLTIGAGLWVAGTAAVVLGSAEDKPHD